MYPLSNVLHTFNNANITIIVGLCSYFNLKAPCFLILIQARVGSGKWGMAKYYNVNSFVQLLSVVQKVVVHIFNAGGTHHHYISLTMEALLPLALYLAYACSVKSARSWVSVKSTWALRNLLRLIAAISCFKIIVSVHHFFSL